MPSRSTYLHDNEPDALLHAWKVIEGHGKNWVKRCQKGAEFLRRHYPDVDLEFMSGAFRNDASGPKPSLG